jgi:uncharacterized protein YjbJ (UPF0337 family)
LAAVSHVYSKVIGEMLLIQINDDHQFTPQLEPLPFRERVSEDTAMDKDRVVGSAKQIKGTVKQVVGKAVGDAKLEAEGNSDKIEGKVQNAIGGVKDTLKGK